MKFKNELLEGTLLLRYKRFFADVEYAGEKFTIHVPNTGSLKTVIEKGKKQKCWFSLHGDESKKLKGTLEAVQADNGTIVGVNTSNPNKIFSEYVKETFANTQHKPKHWKKFQFFKPEYSISKETRLDGVMYESESDLENKKIPKHFIEIKNTTYLDKSSKGPCAMFPDAVTERGQKHISEMMKLIKAGHTAELIFTVQRTDCEYFSAAEHIDPDYAKLLKKAVLQGLIVSPMVVQISKKEVVLTNKLLELI